MQEIRIHKSLHLWSLLTGESHHVLIDIPVYHGSGQGSKHLLTIVDSVNGNYFFLKFYLITVKIILRIL